MPARRYEFYVRVARTISHSFAALTREILFLPLGHKIHIFSPPCNIHYVFFISSKWTYQSFGSTVCTNTFGIFVVLFPSLGQTHLHLTSSYWACDETLKSAWEVRSWHDEVSEFQHSFTKTQVLDCSVSKYYVPSIYRENYSQIN